ncbi:hypothetical protein BX616_009369, partial [Lobosporangium transversale]
LGDYLPQPLYLGTMLFPWAVGLASPSKSPIAVVYRTASQWNLALIRAPLVQMAGDRGHTTWCLYAMHPLRAGVPDAASLIG